MPSKAGEGGDVSRKLDPVFLYDARRTDAARESLRSG